MRKEIKTLAVVLATIATVFWFGGFHLFLTPNGNNVVRGLIGAVLCIPAGAFLIRFILYLFPDHYTTKERRKDRLISAFFVVVGATFAVWGMFGMHGMGTRFDFLGRAFTVLIPAGIAFVLCRYDLCRKSEAPLSTDPGGLVGKDYQPGRC